MVVRDPCNSGDVIVTVAPGSGSPPALTTPASEAVVWPNIVAETREKTHANSVAHERFVMFGPLGVGANIARKKPMRQCRELRGCIRRWTQIFRRWETDSLGSSASSADWFSRRS